MLQYATTVCTITCFRTHLVTERTDRPSLEPSLNTVQVEHVATTAKGDGQSVLVIWRRVRLCRIYRGSEVNLEHEPAIQDESSMLLEKAIV